MNELSTLFSALGFSTAAGFNAYIPLLALGATAHYAPALVRLSAPYDLLANPWVLLVLGLLAILDFIGDKVPAVDHVLHAVGVVVAPVAGALVALAANGGGEVNPVLLAACGLVLAGGAHAARATVRPVATVGTGGLANPALSLAEDVLSAVLSALAMLAPALAALGVVALALGVVVLLRRLAQRRASRGRQRAGG